jgi:DNA-binding SARP family transcriptional activator
MTASASQFETPSSQELGCCLHLLGPPTITQNHFILDIPRRCVRALLYRLACDSELVSRAHLQLLFWPDVPERVARRNLSHHLTHLKRALPLLHLQTSNSGWVAINPSEVWCDVREFHQALFAVPPDTARLMYLASLYRGPFLDGFDLPEHSGFEQWCLVERVSLERQYLKVVEQLVERLAACADTGQAIQFAIKYLAIDPLSESMHRRLIQLYAAAGQRHLALAQFERCSTILSSELGIRPVAETLALYQIVLHGTPNPNSRAS